jgi:glycosyltransferase involved in cell wall biosynthesis
LRSGAVPDMLLPVVETRDQPDRFTLKILILEPYYAGSHAEWATGYHKHSSHDVEILKLGGVYWKWRMHGGAVTLARRFLDSNLDPDLILATDMLDLTTFQALTRVRTVRTPMAMYFHENQLSYPWSPTDRDVQQNRDRHYGFINYVSALAADAVFFNSNYHMTSFLGEVDKLLKHFPDHNEPGSLDVLGKKCSVLSLGLDLGRFDEFSVARSGTAKNKPPLILWNHRWEYDKNPEDFFAVLKRLAGRGIPFEVAVLGENFSQIPDQFLKAREDLGNRIVRFGYVDGFDDYARWLFRADILPVTSHQDFFGAGVAEAVYCGCRPLLPKRLAYPELIPAPHHDSVFYETDDQFEARLGEMLLQPRQPADRGLKAAVSKFDWDRMARVYDRVLENVGPV